METYLSPWLQMDLSSWDSVIQDIKPFSLEKGSLLFANGDFLSNVYIVKSGTLLQINTGDNGNEKILFFMAPGAICGETCLFYPTHPQPYFTRALTDCWIYKIPSEVFLNVLNTDIKTNHHVMEALIQKLTVMGRHLYDLSFLTVYQRLAGEILFYFNMFGTNSPSGDTWASRFLTQQSLADRIGTSRESVNRGLSQMSANGLISFNNKRLCVNNPQELANIYTGTSVFI